MPNSKPTGPSLPCSFPAVAFTLVLMLSMLSPVPFETIGLAKRFRLGRAFADSLYHLSSLVSVAMMVSMGLVFYVAAVSSAARRRNRPVSCRGDQRRLTRLSGVGCAAGDALGQLGGRRIFPWLHGPHHLHQCQEGEAARERVPPGLVGLRMG